MFAAAGWTQQRPNADRASGEVSADAIVDAILAQFSGLQVGQCGPGTEEAASDVCFYRAPRAEVSSVLAPWRLQVGKCAAFATAHHDHMILFVNDDGEYFAFTDPDERLFQLKGGFGEIMQSLLVGYRFGTALPRDAQPFAAAGGFAAS